METFPIDATSILAPLIYIQGIKSVADQLPPRDTYHYRTTKGEHYINYVNEDDISNDLNSVEINRELPDVETSVATDIVSILDNYNLKDSIWFQNNDSKQVNFNIKYVESNCKIYINENKNSVLPNENLNASNYNSKSVLSPFNSNSKFFNNILPIEWIRKYKSKIPFVFISIFELKVDDKSNDSKLIGEINKIKLKFSQILRPSASSLSSPSSTVNFFIIVTCENSIILNPELEVRINSIRRSTNLNSFYLKFLPSGSLVETNTFMLNFLKLLKPISNEFFNNRIKKLKKRELLNNQYSQKFFVSRNSIKFAIFEEFKGITEYSTKLFEFAYEKLITTIYSIDAKSQLKIYNQCRLLLDLISIHIVKSYIFLGDPNMSYKKFFIHLKNVHSISFETDYNWLRLQYTWLGELIEIISNLDEKLISIETPLLPINGNYSLIRPELNNIKFGTLNLPQGGYLYLNALNFLKLDKNFKNYDHQSAILLLNGSLEFFNKNKKVKFNRIESFIYFEIAQEYYLMKNFSMSINNFIVSLSIFKNEKWFKIVILILIKLFDCYINLKQLNESKIYYLQICQLPDYVIKPYLNEIESIKNKLINLELLTDESISGEGIEGNEIDLADEIDDSEIYLKESLFDYSIIIKNQKILLNEELNFQIYLKDKTNDLINELKIEELEIEFSDKNFKKILIKNDSSLQNKKFNKFENLNKNELNLRFNCNLNFDKVEDEKKMKNDFKILNFNLFSNKVGKFKIENLQLRIKINDFITFNNQISIKNNNFKNLKYLKWFKDDLKFEIINFNKNPTIFEIIPKLPNIKYNLNYNELAYNGEKFPISIKFDNQETDKANQVIEISIESKVIINGIPIDVSWNDESSYSNEFKSNKILKFGDQFNCKLVAHLPILSNLPVKKINEKSEKSEQNETFCNVFLKFKYLLKNENDLEIDIEKKFKVNIVELFEIGNVLSPTLNSKILSIFKKDNDIHTQSREWFDKISIRNLSFNEIDVKSIEILVETIKDCKITKNILIKEFKLKGYNEEEFLPIIIETMINNNLNKSIPISVKLKLNYNDNDYFESTVYKNNVPILDPRLLVHLKSIKNDLIGIEYIIENPTNKIFQYQTNLNQIDGIEIIDYKKSMTFSLLPFMKQFIRFEYKLDFGNDDKEHLFQFPEFRVYDLNYKIFLKLNIVDEKLFMKEGQLYFN